MLKDKEMLKKIATTDSLTNLINRYGFEEVIEDQLTYLRKHGCDIIQGYYYSEPLPFENAVTCI